MAVISNTTANTLVVGTAEDDTISSSYPVSVTSYGVVTNLNAYVSATNVTIDAGAGNDEIVNAGSYVSINGGTGDDTIFIERNDVSNVTVDAGDGNDYIDNWLTSSLSINGGTGDDTIQSAGAGNVTIFGGDGSDSINNHSEKTTIDAGNGEDLIFNRVDSVSIYGGNGNDTIYNSDDDVSVNGGAGNDQISLVSASNNLIQYTEGDGHDTIWGYSGYDNTNSLQINSSVGWSSVVSGNNVVIYVGDGSITLVDAATSSSGVNINGVTYPVAPTASIAPVVDTSTVTAVDTSTIPAVDTSTIPATVTPETLPPAVGGAAYDIVFILDVSGSMDTYINRVNEIAQTFVDKLAERGITNYRLGVVEFESESVIYPLGAGGTLFTTDVEAFKSAMTLASSRTRGGTENGLTALTDAVTNYAWQFRPEANKEFIVLTDEDFDDGAIFDVSAVEQMLTTNGIQLDVIGQIDGWCDGAWRPVANSTGGNFYDINGNYAETFSEIVLNLDCVNVNLATVPDGQIGYFFLVPGNHVTDLKSVDAVFVMASDPNLEVYAQTFEIVGTVTADKVYNAASSRYRQNITIPDLWNVTATAHSDILNVAGTGFGVVITGGNGHDDVKLGEFATGVILTDHSLDQDGISFAAQQIKGTFTESVETNPVTLMNQVTLASPTMAIYLQNFSSPLLEDYENTHAKFLAYSVTNVNTSTTVYDLLYGEESYTAPLIGNGDGRIIFAQWGYGFTPPDDNPLITGIVPPIATSFDLVEDFGSPSLDEISPVNFAVTANDLVTQNFNALNAKVTEAILASNKSKF